MNYQKIKISGYKLKLSDVFPAAIFNSEGTGLFPDGQRSSFTKLPSSKFANVFKFNVYFKGRIHSLILKQYLNRSGLDVLKNLLFSCRAYRAFKADLMLKQYGFLTPDIVAVGKKTLAGITTRNFLITGHVEDSVPLYKMLDTNISQKQQLIEQFGQTVGRMHAAGIFHGDLRFGNILVKTDNGRFVFVLLDNERTRKFKKLSQRLRLKNLVQIWISRTNAEESERKCFLDAYLSQQNIKFDREKLSARIASGVKKRLTAKGLINHE
jgi:tRNA A-37 threonylcarbamoyl transferase component Bud32